MRSSFTFAAISPQKHCNWDNTTWLTRCSVLSHNSVGLGVVDSLNTTNFSWEKKFIDGVEHRTYVAEACNVAVPHRTLSRRIADLLGALTTWASTKFWWYSGCWTFVLSFLVQFFFPRWWILYRIPSLMVLRLARVLMVRCVASSSTSATVFSGPQLNETLYCFGDPSTKYQECLSWTHFAVFLRVCVPVYIKLPNSSNSAMNRSIWNGCTKYWKKVDGMKKVTDTRNCYNLHRNATYTSSCCLTCSPSVQLVL